MSKGNCGDRIRVVDAETGETYRNGHEGVILRAQEDWSGAEVRFDYHSNDKSEYLCGYEYDVIEDSQEQNTEQEIPWEVGQEVWDLRKGKGVVLFVKDYESKYPVTVEFPDGSEQDYTLTGVYFFNDKHRSLYFSEPKIVAETMPPEKPFVPTLKIGELVVAVNQVDGSQEALIVALENKDGVVCTTNAAEITYLKSKWNFYKLSEQVEFN